MEWSTQGKHLEKLDVPPRFYTTSSVCIISNWWDDDDAVMTAIESRAEFVYFDPAWPEVYKQAATWFWDQEIFDHVHSNLNHLSIPDCRLFMKAYHRKMAGLKTMSWKSLVDAYKWDDTTQTVAALMEDKSYKSNAARGRAFCEQTGKDVTTFYRHLKQWRKYSPEAKVERLTLIYTRPPEVERPEDEVVEIEE